MPLIHEFIIITIIIINGTVPTVPRTQETGCETATFWFENSVFVCLVACMHACMQSSTNKQTFYTKTQTTYATKNTQEGRTSNINLHLCLVACMQCSTNNQPFYTKTQTTYATKNTQEGRTSTINLHFTIKSTLKSALARTKRRRLAISFMLMLSTNDNYEILGKTTVVKLFLQSVVQ